MYKKWHLSKNHFISLDITKKYTSGYISLTKLKGIEWYICYRPSLFSVVSLWFRTKMDHPGVALECRLFGIGFELDFYDSRHWNSKKVTYE